MVATTAYDNSPLFYGLDKSDKIEGLMVTVTQ